MNGIEKLHPENHGLYRRVQHLVSLKWKWEAIADDVGLVGPRRVMDLCEWVLEYKEPKPLPMVRTDAPITWQGKALRDPKALTQQFIAWRRQHEGARKALEGVE